jgi:hypothetical protein
MPTRRPIVVAATASGAATMAPRASPAASDTLGSHTSRQLPPRPSHPTIKIQKTESVGAQFHRHNSPLSGWETDLPHIAVPDRASDDRQYPRAEAPRGALGGHKRHSPSVVKAEFDCPVRVRISPASSVVRACPSRFEARGLLTRRRTPHAGLWLPIAIRRDGRAPQEASSRDETRTGPAVERRRESRTPLGLTERLGGSRSGITWRRFGGPAVTSRSAPWPATEPT